MSRITYNGKSLQIGGKSIISTISSTFDGWFLPSRDLFQNIYNNLGLVGGFDTNGMYWTSSESDISNAYIINYRFGNTGASLKSGLFRVRACRSFISNPQDYVIGDDGPKGGIICYIDDNIYYEIMTTDLSTGYAWSNVIDVEIGTTGTAIGNGYQNTLDIINQDGHTDSAAKLCNDLVI